MTARCQHRRPLLRGGYALPAVLLFLALAFGAWAVCFRSTGSMLRVEQARVLRDSRATWTAPAMATALRLLETGDPPSDPYDCKLTRTWNGQTRYFHLRYDGIAANRWIVDCQPTDADDPAPDAPPYFVTIPNSPTALAAVAFSSTRIDLVWADVIRENGYVVQRSPNGTTGWTQITTTPQNIALYSNIGLTSGTTYYYRVAAIGSGGTSTYSNVAFATTPSLIPPAPSGLGGVALSTTSIRLQWTDNSINETGFVIERSNNGTGWGNAVTVTPNMTTQVITGLKSGRTYYFRIHATGVVGDSGWSDVATVATP